MTKLGRLIIFFLINCLYLYGAAYFIPGFFVSLEPKIFLETAAIFTLLNLLIKPILRFFLAPLIWITLGFGSFILNALLIYSLSQLSHGLTINGLKPLLLATLVVSLINTLCERLLLPKS